MGYAIRTEQYRLVMWFKGEFHKQKIEANSPVMGIELYDYKKDPLEKENLAEKPAYQQILNQHKHLITTLLQTQNQSR